MPKVHPGGDPYPGTRAAWRAFGSRSYYHAAARSIGIAHAPMKVPSLLILTALTFGASAQGPAGAPPPPPGVGGFLEAPPPASSPVTGEAVEPEIIIREEGGHTVTEYRVNGMLYMVRIAPQFGPAYFLLDVNGDGVIDPRDGSPFNNIIPQWLLFSWQ